jgi:uncharacterized protein YjdB
MNIKTLHLNPSTLNFKTPQDQPVRLEVNDQDGREISHDELKYNSTNTSVASVDVNGEVHPRGNGNAQITVTLNADQKIQASAQINVAGQTHAAGQH